jgi:hypothetical protein
MVTGLFLVPALAPTRRDAKARGSAVAAIAVDPTRQSFEGAFELDQVPPGNTGISYEPEVWRADACA